MIKTVQILFSFSYGRIKFRTIKIFNDFSTLFLVLAVHFAYPYYFRPRKKKKKDRKKE